MSYLQPERRLQALTLAEAPNYGGPQRNSIAMLIRLAGLTGDAYPDEQYVQAFARHDPGAHDLDTVLGAALSFSESGRRIIFAGVPAQPRHLPPATVHQWQDWLAELPNVETSYEPPDPAQLEKLLQEPDGTWAIKMDVAGSALPGVRVAFQPAIVVGAHDGLLTVHNPGGGNVALRFNQELDLPAAFGRTAKAQARVSILAVRMTTGPI